MRVYGDRLSGNCYKIQLLLHHLGTAHEWVDVDILRGDTRTERFLALNANGKIPVLELDDGRVLPESNAILNYLADGTDFLPDDAWARAQVLAWQFFEQYSHEPAVAVARFIVRYQGTPEARREELARCQARAKDALLVMERHLAGHEFFVGGRMTIADFSLYAYTHVAHEGGVTLEAYPAIRAWLDRVAGHPRHSVMAEGGA